MLLTHSPRISFHLSFSQQALFMAYALEWGFPFLLLALSSSSWHSDGWEARQNMGWCSTHEFVLLWQDDGMISGRGRAHGIERNESYDYEYS
jgi:hypothetical protein